MPPDSADMIYALSHAALAQVTNMGSETRMGVDFADIYEHSDLTKCARPLVSRAALPEHWQRSLEGNTAEQLPRHLCRPAGVLWPARRNQVRQAGDTRH